MEQKALFSERLKFARINKRLSQMELCDLIGISRVSLMHYETGRRTPSVEVLENLSEVLEVSVGFLLGKEEYPEANLQIPQSMAPKRVRRRVDIEKRGNRDILMDILSQSDQETTDIIDSLVTYLKYDSTTQKTSSSNKLPINDEDYEEFYLWKVQNALRRFKSTMK